MAPTDPGDPRSFGDVGTKLLIDNDQVRVWELRLDPDQRSPLHHHRHDYVMVQIAGDRIAAEFEPDSAGTFAGNDYLEGAVGPGRVSFAESGGKETAVNVGSETFREIVVEVKATRRPGMLTLQHASLMVTDLGAALTFYTDVLGFEVLPRPDLGEGAWLGTGNGVQIHLIPDADFVAPNGPHLAFETDDVDAEVARLREAGVEVGDPFQVVPTMRQAFFHDPAGNQLEFNQPLDP